MQHHPAILALALSAPAAAQVYVGPVPYTSPADRPAGFLAGSVALEDMEDLSVDFGIVTSDGGTIGPGVNIDSVDGDDGSIDGFGRDGRSYFGTGSILIEFPAPVREAAVVWTDGPAGTRVEFEAFGPGMVSLGIHGPFQHANGSTLGQTDEDRIYGARHPDGIVAIRLLSLDGNTTIELDHVQYGSLGTSYCTANPNSTGHPGIQTVIGSAAVADRELTLVASRLPESSFGYFLASRTQGFVAGAGGSAGNLCLGGSVGRFTSSIFNTGTTGSAAVQANLSAFPTPTGAVAVQPGETWHFQAWHRDSSGGAPTSNFTDAVSVPFS
ncbi:MAG: hypothetical protein AAGB93_06110 [Planctomycetota bacterium]